MGAEGVLEQKNSIGEHVAQGVSQTQKDKPHISSFLSLFFFFFFFWGGEMVLNSDN